MTRTLRMLCGAAVAVAVLVSSVSVAGDRVDGRRIAQRWCSGCHVVAPGQRQGSDTAPTFAQIAEAERFDEATLATFLAVPHHSRMPNLSLTRSEIADLVAYIAAQRH